MFMPNADVILLIVLPAVTVLLVAFMVWQYRRLEQQHIALHNQFCLLQTTAQQASLDVVELRQGIIGVGQRVLQLEQREQQLLDALELHQSHIATLLEQQQDIQLFDPDSRIYSRAMKMVQLGAGLDEIMRECELPRAEAELLLNLHRNHQ
jgi:uncharacterized protein (DUF3084 family)